MDWKGKWDAQVEKSLNVHSSNQTNEQEKELHLARASHQIKPCKSGQPWRLACLGHQSLHNYPGQHLGRCCDQGQARRMMWERESHGPGQWNLPSSKICLMTRMLTSAIADTGACVGSGRIEETRILLVKIGTGKKMKHMASWPKAPSGPR